MKRVYHFKEGIDMKKIIIFTILFVLLMTGFSYAQIGGELQTNYLSIREQLEFVVGANYKFDRGEIGFRVHTYTTMPLDTQIPPYFGFAPKSTLYTWYGEIRLIDGIYVHTERYCEHWAKQAEIYEDYMGYKVGIRYEF